MNNEYKEMLEIFDQICQNAKKELLCAKEEKEKQKRFIEKIDKELTISEYDEIEYWLANVEILDNTDYILHSDKAKVLLDYITNLEQENEELKVENEKLTQLWLDSQEKRRKAIKYLEQPYRDNFDYSKSELLEILGGDE